MAFIKVGRENSADIELFYEDHGLGPPVVLIHGFPLNGRSWEKQERALLQGGYRVITYDRRGFGQSSQPSLGYDYDTLAADLNALMSQLDLNDASLVGFSMGTGEVTRYLSRYGSERVLTAVLMAPLQPFLLKTADNSQGVDGSVFEDIQKAILSDRPAFLKSFLDNFYNVDRLRGRRISDEAWQASFNVSVAASAKGTFDCVSAWQTDFREDLPKLDVPLLIVQGDEDRILPYAATGKRLASLVEAELVVVKGGPHAIGWTHADEVNGALMPFLRRYTSPVLGERRPSTEGAPTVH